MSNRNPLDYSINKPLVTSFNPFSYLFKDITLVSALIAVLVFGLAMLYSSSGQSFSMVMRQSIYVFAGLIMTVSYTHLTLPTIYSV